MSSCNCRGGPNCCMLNTRSVPDYMADFRFNAPNPQSPKMETRTGSVITIYLHTEDDRQIEAIAEAVADTLDIAAGRPKTSEDHLPYIVTVGPVELPEDVVEFMKMAAEGKTMIICPHPISDDTT